MVLIKEMVIAEGDAGIVGEGDGIKRSVLGM